MPAAQHEEVKQNMGRELAEVNSSKEKLASEIKEMKKKVNFYITKRIFYSKYIIYYQYSTEVVMFKVEFYSTNFSE